MTGGYEDRIKVVYAAQGDRATLDDAYDDWATEYDRDIWSTGNPYMAMSVAMVARHVRDFEARILDAGCGTGIAGKLLQQIGFRNLEGLDASSGMLRVARGKGCYSKHYQILLAGEIPLENQSYDAIVAVGVLTQGHAPAESLDGMLRLAKPGGLLIFTMTPRAMQDDGFAAKIDEISAAGKWLLIEKTPEAACYPQSQELKHVVTWVSVYRKSE